MLPPLQHRMIGEIVSEHYVFAYVLFFYGVEFFEHTNKTLEEVCMEKDLKLENVVNSFESIRIGPDSNGLKLDEVPIELVISYLKHSHHVFIKQRLPFLMHLVERLHQTGPQHPIVKDLQTAFPLFAEDFIKHIYEEEDTIFAQIMYLASLTKQEEELFPMFSMLNNVSIAKYAEQHKGSERDELYGIRELTQQYSAGTKDNIQMKVLMEDLKSFDQELCIHARIENEILLPKGEVLEEQVWEMLQLRAVLN